MFANAGAAACYLCYLSFGAFDYALICYKGCLLWFAFV